MACQKGVTQSIQICAMCYVLSEVTDAQSWQELQLLLNISWQRQIAPLLVN